MTREAKTPTLHAYFRKRIAKIIATMSIFYPKGSIVSTLNSKDAAAHIGKSVSWLNKSRMTGTGPVYLKLGGSVRYALGDLNAWLASNRRTAIYDFANDNRRATAAA
ncbi:MAG: hypothetical protein EOR43_18250 [Mesorhizobium sp.]|nr:MAG: hypothetical protein EOR43_18250 [Mesorhizobium sp.]RWK29925.1 MAG: hypothetical protein EOR44_18650 [Mesorhizobium sp.]